MSGRRLGPAARRRKIESAREHLMRACWALLDVREALAAIPRERTEAEQIEVRIAREAMRLAEDARDRLNSLEGELYLAHEGEGQERIEL